MTYNFEGKINFHSRVLFKTKNPMKYYMSLSHVTADSFLQKMYLDNKIGTLFNSTILSFLD